MAVGKDMRTGNDINVGAMAALRKRRLSAHDRGSRASSAWIQAYARFRQVRDGHRSAVMRSPALRDETLHHLNSGLLARHQMTTDRLEN